MKFPCAILLYKMVILYRNGDHNKYINLKKIVQTTTIIISSNLSMHHSLNFIHVFTHVTHDFSTMLRLDFYGWSNSLNFSLHNLDIKYYSQVGVIPSYSHLTSIMNSLCLAILPNGPIFILNIFHFLPLAFSFRLHLFSSFISYLKKHN